MQSKEMIRRALVSTEVSDANVVEPAALAQTEQKSLHEMAQLLDVDLATLISDNFIILDVKQVAKLLRVSTKTVYKRAGLGLIPCKKIGNRYRFLLPELIGWLKGDAVYVL